YTQLEAALDAHPGELVVIATPPAAHAGGVGTALEHGRHVVLDKPVTPTAREAAELRDSAREKGLTLTAIHNRRWDGDLRVVAGLVHDGVIGRVVRFEASFYWLDSGDSWKSDTSVVDGGGVLHDVGPHLIDQALLLFGPAQVVHAEAIHRTAARAPD